MSLTTTSSTTSTTTKPNDTVQQSRRDSTESNVEVKSHSYLPIHALWDTLWEISKQVEKNVRVSRRKTYHLILDVKYMYDNEYNKEIYNCIPIALSIRPEEFLTSNDLCKLFYCLKIYITIEKEGKEHILDKNKSLQIINITTCFEKQDDYIMPYVKIRNDNKYYNE